MRKIEDIKEIRRIQLNVLANFDSFCKEHNLKYFLAFGTLLGAVRHKGFIPWDDDIDVFMLRDDYNKLIRYYKDGRFKLMSVERLKKNQYSYAYAKLVDAETLLIEKIRPNQKLGIGIDIFPLDYLKNNEEYHDKLIKRYARINYFDTAKGKKGIFIRIIGKKGWSRIYNVLHFVNKYKFSHIGNCCSINTSKDYYECSWFEKTVQLPFEDDIFEAPIEYKKVLEERFGDYMTLPEENKRKPLHSYEAFIK